MQSHQRRGRRYRMLIAPHYDSLCLQHLREAAASQPDDAALADELLNSTGDLASVGEVNAFLGNVVKLRARRVSLAVASAKLQVDRRRVTSSASLTNAAKPAWTPSPRIAESGASCHF
jgi:hypothetical protein